NYSERREWSRGNFVSRSGRHQRGVSIRRVGRDSHELLRRHGQIPREDFTQRRSLRDVLSIGSALTSCLTQRTQRTPRTAPIQNPISAEVTMCRRQSPPHVGGYVRSSEFDVRRSMFDIPPWGSHPVVTPGI